MGTINWISIEEGRLAPALQGAAEKLDGQEVVLDFSALQRIDASGLLALEEFAQTAASKGVKVVVRGLRVDVYRALKLARISSRFSYAA